ncbi:sugar phosphate isomerase/epimerase [Granulicella sp. dw_53]|uniref:sugar phosphate isomerase/epimerase family protein n=1 Tax=Granulicella sp. dw_53 TaxID=2719792 RepID=UPI001BD5B6A2|nr:sugar phosphate isomerase/epimerase [Granulicella sp. dw_53]
MAFYNVGHHFFCISYSQTLDKQFPAGSELLRKAQITLHRAQYKYMPNSNSGSELPVNSAISRRTFMTKIAIGSAAATFLPGSLLAASFSKIPIGYTGITWANSQVEDAIASCAKLGFYGFETFGDVLAQWDSKGGLGPVLKRNRIPLISGYCTLNLTDSTRRQETIEKAVRWSKLLKESGGRIFVLGPNPVPRDSYKFAEYKANIVATLNEASKAIVDQGLTPVLHQHTGTCVETRDETYATLDAIDHSTLKFGPDVGQLTKGGADAVKVVKDYLPLVQHMHLKDFDGKDPSLVYYCPLGKGKVDVPAILDLMAGRTISGMVMVELDNDPKNPSSTPPSELAGESQAYLKKIGVKLRA